MVERAFGSLGSVMDELLAGEAERPGRQTGDDIFESDPKGLLGSLLKFKEEAAVEGVGRYATIRTYQGHRQAPHGFAQGGAELKQGLARGRQLGGQHRMDGAPGSEPEGGGGGGWCAGGQQEDGRAEGQERRRRW